MPSPITAPNAAEVATARIQVIEAGARRRKPTTAQPGPTRRNAVVATMRRSPPGPEVTPIAARTQASGPAPSSSSGTHRLSGPAHQSVPNAAATAEPRGSPLRCIRPHGSLMTCAPPPGFEPGPSEPKSEVLPLHHGGPALIPFCRSAARTCSRVGNTLTSARAARLRRPGCRRPAWRGTSRRRPR